MKMRFLITLIFMMVLLPAQEYPSEKWEMPDFIYQYPPTNDKEYQAFVDELVRSIQEVLSEPDAFSSHVAYQYYYRTKRQAIFAYMLDIRKNHKKLYQDVLKKYDCHGSFAMKRRYGNLSALTTKKLKTLIRQDLVKEQWNSRIGIYELKHINAFCPFLYSKQDRQFILQLAHQALLRECWMEALLVFEMLYETGNEKERLALSFPLSFIYIYYLPRAVESASGKQQGRNFAHMKKNKHQILFIPEVGTLLGDPGRHEYQQQIICGTPMTLQKFILRSVEEYSAGEYKKKQILSDREYDYSRPGDWMILFSKGITQTGYYEYTSRYQRAFAYYLSKQDFIFMSEVFFVLKHLGPVFQDLDIDSERARFNAAQRIVTQWLVRAHINLLDSEHTQKMFQSAKVFFKADVWAKRKYVSKLYHKAMLKAFSVYGVYTSSMSVKKLIKFFQ